MKEKEKVRKRQGLRERKRRRGNGRLNRTTLKDGALVKASHEGVTPMGKPVPVAKCAPARWFSHTPKSRCCSACEKVINETLVI